MKKLLLLICIFLLPFVHAVVDDCNKQCVIEGSSSGTCRTSCDMYEQEVGGVSGCTLVGSAAVVMGEDSIQSFYDGDPYIDENSLNWTWILKSLTSKQSTSINNASDINGITGIQIGMKNKFDAISLTGPKAPLSAGENICFPGGELCFSFDSLTVENYAGYQIKYEIADFSSVFPGWVSKKSIHITSAGVNNGLFTQRDNYDLPVIASDVETTNIWIAYNQSNYITIFYEDGSGNKHLAGHVLMDGAGDNTNIVDIQYLNTRGSNIQIALTGNSGSVDALNLVVDVLGDEGLPAINGYDDITIALSHAASGDFDGLGDTPGVAEASEIVWRSSSLGVKTGNFMTLYGIHILTPYIFGALDSVHLEIPEDQVKGRISLTKTYDLSVNSTTITSTTLEVQAPPEPALMSDVQNLRDYNLIVIGGPCVNLIVPAIFGLTCSDWTLQPGQALLKLSRNGNNTALLIAGTTAADTENAVDLLVSRSALEASDVRIISETSESSKGLFSGISEGLNQLSGNIPGSRIIIKETSNPRLNLSRYPYPFLNGNEYNKLKIVYSEKGNIRDSFAAEKIAENLANSTGITVFTSNNLSEDQTETSVQTLQVPLGTSIGDENYFGNPVFATQSFFAKFFGVRYHVRDVMVFINDGPRLETSLSSGEDTYDASVYLPILKENMRYYYVFDDPIDLSSATPDDSYPMQFLDQDFLLTEVESNRMLTEEGREYILEVGQSVDVSGKHVSLFGAAESGVVLNINGVNDIFKYGIRERRQGLNIKPIVGFTHSSAKCCCFDIFSYFR